MEGLMDFYSAAGTHLPELDFNEQTESISLTSITYDPQRGMDSARKVVSNREEMSTATLESLQGRKLIACIATVPLIKGRNPYLLDISEKNYNHVLDTFGLRDYTRYAGSTRLTFDVIPRFENGKVCGFYASLFYDHFFGLYTSYSEASGLTLGLCWGGENILPAFVASISNLRSLASQPGFFLLATAAALNFHLSYRLPTMDVCVSQVEKSTGYMGWDMSAYESANGSLSDLSATMSGYRTSLAAGRRVSKACDEILSKVGSDKCLISGYVPLKSNSTEDMFTAHHVTLLRRVRMQNIHIEFLFSRIDNQLTALFNLTNRDETKRSIGLAKDSRMIALASRRDSSSMKTLAAVTVVFLPGTFIASLFSMSMFDWHADSQSVLTSRFWIYWVITVPLTLVTICIWYVWTNRRAALIRSRDQEGLDDLEGTTN